MNIPDRYKILFSFWVLYWSIAYCLVREFAPQIPLDLWDPTFALLVAISYQIYVLLNVLFRAKRELLPIILAKYTIVIVSVKLIPLYLVWKHRVNWTNSILSFASVFLVYCVFLAQQNLNIFKIYYDVAESYVHNDVTIPFQEFLDFLLP